MNFFEREMKQKIMLNELEIIFLNKNEKNIIFFEKKLKEKIIVMNQDEFF